MASNNWLWWCPKCKKWRSKYIKKSGVSDVKCNCGTAAMVDRNSQGVLPKDAMTFCNLLGVQHPDCSTCVKVVIEGGQLWQGCNHFDIVEPPESVTKTTLQGAQ